MDNKLAVADYRQIGLADLVALGQVGIEIILAREHRARRDMGAGGEAKPDRALHRALVQHRQHAGQSEAHRIRLRVRLRAERGRGAAEDLAIGRELRVYFQPDDDFPGHVVIPFVGWIKAAGRIHLIHHGGYALRALSTPPLIQTPFRSSLLAPYRPMKHHTNREPLPVGMNYAANLRDDAYIHA